MPAPTETEARGSLRRCLTASLAGALMALACQGGHEVSTGGETHFLTRCEASSESCGSELSCLYDVCTLSCDDAAACEAYPGAECVAAPQAGGADYCDFLCAVDADCATLSTAHRCDGGACRAGEAASECPTGEIEANEVLLIGDSFFAASHQITAFLEDLAREGGALSAGERYRDNSSPVVNSLGGGDIANQYTAGLAEAPVKLVIMSGGGVDVLLGSCETPDAECPVIADAAAAARELLNRMAADGVLDVLYVSYPDPVDLALREKVDALRPLLQSACEESVTPCHWVDLRTAFEGRYEEYVQPDGINPTAAGSQASALQIWETLRANCIAQ